MPTFYFAKDLKRLAMELPTRVIFATICHLAIQRTGLVKLFDPHQWMPSDKKE